MNMLLKSCMILGAATAFGGVAPAEEHRVFRHENVLGTSLELRVAARDEAAAQWAEAAVLEEIDRLDMLLSTYRDDSELAHWLRATGTPLPISRELFEVLSASERWRLASGGAFNPQAQVASGFGRVARRRLVSLSGTSWRPRCEP